MKIKWWYKQMSNCGKSGCKEEPLAADEEERVSFFIFLHSFTLFFFPPQRGLRAYSHLIIVTISTLNLFSGNSVFLQWQDWLGSWFDCSHLGVPRRRKHWHLTHVKKGGMDVKNCPCLWSCSWPCHPPAPMDLFTMISFQSHLEYNTYRWDKAGKKLQVLWKISSFNTGKIKVSTSTFTDFGVHAEVCFMINFDNF